MNVEAHVFFYGRVQGVFFRATARQLAEELQLQGTVRNCEDGSVEMRAQGAKENVEQLLAKLANRFELDDEIPMKIAYHEQFSPIVGFHVTK